MSARASEHSIVLDSSLTFPCILLCQFHTGVNVYPFFSAGNEDLPTQWAKMLKRYPQHTEKIRLTETGWPSNGETLMVVSKEGVHGVVIQKVSKPPPA